MELVMGIEPMTSSLPRKCSTTELHKQICYIAETKLHRNMSPCCQGRTYSGAGSCTLFWLSAVNSIPLFRWFAVKQDQSGQIREIESRLPQSVANIRRCDPGVKGIFSFRSSTSRFPAGYPAPWPGRSGGSPAFTFCFAADQALPVESAQGPAPQSARKPR